MPSTFTSRILSFSKRPEMVFLALAFVFGFVFVFLTPPFQVPDEPAHFYRAYQVSEGQLISVKENQRVGGSLPSSLKKLVNSYLPLVGGSKYSTDSAVGSADKLPLARNQREFIDFNSTAFYSPVCYLPQALGIALCRMADVSVIALFYSARIATLLTWIIFVFVALQLLPVARWLFCLLALLPMSVFINSSLSADVMTNGLAFLFIAVILNTRFTLNFSKRRIVLIAALLFTLPLLKTIYAALAILLLILPFRVLPDLKQRVSVIALFISSIVIPFLFWSNMGRHLYITYDEYDPAYRDEAALIKGVYPEKQLAQMKEHKVIFFRMIRRSTYRLLKYHVPGFTGVFGWSDLKPPAWFSYSLFIIVLLVALSQYDPAYVLTWKMKLLFVATFCITLSGIFLSLFLIWTVMGPQVVKFIQPRYLIPIYPLLLLCLNSKYSFKLRADVIVTITAVAGLLFSMWMITERYY